MNRQVIRLVSDHRHGTVGADAAVTSKPSSAPGHSVLDPGAARDPGVVAHDPAALLASIGPLRLQHARVHVWSFSLEGAPPVLEQCRQYLSPAERQRADRFVFPRDRLHHTVAHGIMRHLLGAYCDAPPESLEFDVSAAGKPRLRALGGGSAGALQFNLTHSGDRAVLGVSDGRELGVDLEKIRCDVEALAISRHYFFGSEREAIEKAPPLTQDDMFFRYWVAKEAVLKAQGIGLGFPLDRFRVDFLPDGRSARIETLDPSQLESAWTVRMLPCETGWLGAVAARGADWDVKAEGPVVTDPPHL
jgi:4'-phosphopantetheinyl transferase